MTSDVADAVKQFGEFRKRQAADAVKQFGEFRKRQAADAVKQFGEFRKRHASDSDPNMLAALSKTKRPGGEDIQKMERQDPSLEYPIVSPEFAAMGLTHAAKGVAAQAIGKAAPQFAQRLAPAVKETGGTFLQRLARAPGNIMLGKTSAPMTLAQAGQKAARTGSSFARGSVVGDVAANAAIKGVDATISEGWQRENPDKAMAMKIIAALAGGGYAGYKAEKVYMKQFQPTAQTAPRAAPQPTMDDDRIANAILPSTPDEALDVVAAHRQAEDFRNLPSGEYATKYPQVPNEYRAERPFHERQYPAPKQDPGYRPDFTMQVNNQPVPHGYFDQPSVSQIPEPPRQAPGHHPGTTPAPQGQPPELPRHQPSIDDAIRAAYQSVAERDGFSHVLVSDLAEASGVPLQVVKEHLTSRGRAGTATFGTGDWSLSSHAAREAAIEINGQPHTRVKLLEEQVNKPAAEPHNPLTPEQQAEANRLFMHGLDNIAAGAAAGIETDDAGNVTMDPANFVMGLGGYTVVKHMLKNPAVQGKIREMAQEAIDVIDMNPQVQKSRGLNAMAIGSTPKSNVINFVKKVLTSSDNRLHDIEIARPTSSFTEWAKTNLGVDIKGYSRHIDNYAVKHIIKQHGNSTIEAKRGQIAITEDDIALYDDITANPDQIARGGITKQGRDTIAYQKKYGDNIYVVEEIRTNRKTLVPVTMWKMKGTTPDASGFDWKPAPRLNAQDVSSMPDRARDIIPQDDNTIARSAGGAIGGGFVGGASALYEDATGGDLSTQDYLARIAGGAAVGKGLENIGRIGSAIGSGEKFLNTAIQDVAKFGFRTADAAAGGRITETLKRLNDSEKVDFLLGQKIYDKTDYMRARGDTLSGVNRVADLAETQHEQLKLFSAEAREGIYRYMTGEQVNISPALKRLAAHYRTEIDKMGQELVADGVLSKDAYEEWAGMYLHRKYSKHFGKGVKDFFSGKGGFGTEQIKMRGKPWVGSQQEYDQLAAQGMLGRVSEGKISASQRLDGNYDFRRDWTPEERANMGEIRDAAYSVPETMLHLATLIEHGKLLKSIPEKYMAPIDTKFTHEALEQQGFELLKGVRFGPLNGRYVSRDIANDIRGITRMFENSAWQKGYQDYVRAVKASHTIYNPTAHFNNFNGNVFMQFVAGLNPVKAYRYAIKGAGMLRNDLPDFTRLTAKEPIGLSAEEAARLAQLRADPDVQLWNAAKAEGLFGRSRLNDVLNQYMAPSVNREETLLGRARGTAERTYQGEDDVMRFSALKQLAEGGMDVKSAVKKINEEIIPDYTRPMSKAGDWLRRYGFVPFLSWTYYSTPMMTRQVARNPARALALFGALWGMNYASGVTGGEDLPSGGKGYEGKTLAVPGLSSGDEKVLWRYGNTEPHVQLTEPLEMARSMAVSGIPQQLYGVAQGIGDGNSMQNPFFGSPVTYRKGGEQYYDEAKHVIQNVAPTPDFLDKLFNLAEARIVAREKRRTNPVVKPRSDAQELLNLLGINVKTYSKSAARAQNTRNELKRKP